LQVDHTHDEKSTAALYEELWKMLEMLTGFEVVKFFFLIMEQVFRKDK